MKLQTKLTLFNTVSKLVIVLLFVALLPTLIKTINLSFTDSRLKREREKVLEDIQKKGIEEYMPNGQAYGSYTPLKEDYVSLDTASDSYFLDTIRRERRLVEGDTISYRILSYTFSVGKKDYLLEIGKSVKTIDETTGPLQNIALEVLLGMMLLTILSDLFYSNYILRPLGLIIKTKLVERKFPQFGEYKKVETSTSDFERLDVSIHEMIGDIERAFLKEREFISNASHELMTPVSILQSKIENMFDEDVTDEVKIRLLEMQRILNRLKTITKTLLLISQIENEQFLKEDSIGVSELLQDVYEEISIRLQEKNISFEAVVSDQVRFTAVNKFLLFNLFFNLVNNAIKYNKEDGNISITGREVKDGYMISVADSGIGIGAEQLPHIFNRFKKFRQSMEQDSFGLGLPIVRSIAEFHKIRIDIRSEENVGTTFDLTFPAEMITV
ncbi:sensor histidine kinase [Mucilaginibacter myungsuensis]|uniref:histidine kinase n=1 Tax=Mucilaginibacter myungsuensis TaxID=649104 RepID=A0A929KU90_9SPHI|nr:HAMP domain-containing sensor histidine kinase [Mucilaginibacter myungsuensis]MBE9661676.1 HAMP domain-containing histidine kinase [Mucilaginibacter myungsuensis]MDN3597820.1 HAMP domain-containing sensor histidine kinase [Mucilaginibacter myungsuensis]